MKLKVGIVGLGYWGPNYLRNFIRCEQTEAIWGCDLSSTLLEKVNNFYPQVKLTQDYNDLLDDKSLDLIAIATPPQTHYQIAKAALEAGKHVFIAKPLATKTSEVLDLIKLAKKKELLIHCDLTYLYTAAVKTMKQLISSNAIGQPLYYDSIRTNLGLIQNNVSVIWDLAPHDLSIIDYCFGLKPKQVYAIGSSHHGNKTNEEIAHISIKYTDNFIAHINVSWISPVKLRTILVGGREKMIFFDDIEPDEKIKLYDKSIQFPPGSITPAKPAYRSGNVVIPKLDNEEALFVEIEEVIKSINEKRISYDNATSNINIIKLLEACDESLRLNKPVDFK